MPMGISYFCNNTYYTELKLNYLKKKHLNAFSLWTSLFCYLFFSCVCRGLWGIALKYFGFITKLCKYYILEVMKAQVNIS